MSTNRLATETELITLSEAARRCGASYKRIWDAAQSRKLQTERVGKKLMTTAAWLDSFVALTAAAEKEPVVPDDAGVPDEYKDLQETCRRFHELGINQAVILRSLEADALSTDSQGDVERAGFIRWLRANLPTTQYFWDSDRGRWLVHVPAAGVVASADTKGRFAP